MEYGKMSRKRSAIATVLPVFIPPIEYVSSSRASKTPASPPDRNIDSQNANNYPFLALPPRAGKIECRYQG